MTNMSIFQPMLAQVILMLVVTFWLAYARVGSLARGKLTIKDVAKHGWPGWIKNAGDNYKNQYEAPVLFFVVCFILYITGAAVISVIYVAWFFVATRVVHALIQLSTNTIKYRFVAFLLGIFALIYLTIVAVMAVF